MRRQLMVVTTVLVATLCACHSQSPRGSTGRSVRDTITREEIETSNASNVYELVNRLRAEYLRDRGPASLRSNQRSRAVVFMNDQEYGILETMRNIPISHIAEIRFYSGIDAVAKYGSQYGGGVVLLISRVE